MTIDTWDPVSGAMAGIGITFLLWWLTVMLLFGGLPAAWLAQVRGREPVLWLFVGVVLGPVAVLLVGFAPYGTKGEWGQCAQCRSSVRRGARRCPFCGSDGSGYR